MKNETLKILSSGVNISCNIFGNEADVLVMLHGNGEDHNCFKKQFEEFSEYFRLIAIDSRGHGASEFGKDKLCLELIVEDLKNVLDAMKTKKVHILGFSDGGNIALMFAMKYPEYVDKLVLVGANLDPSGVRDDDLRMFEKIYRKLVFFSLFSKKYRKKKQVFGLMINEPNISVEDLKKVSSETLVIAGENDVIKEEHTRLIASSIPGARLELIPGGDHFALQKLPEKTNPMILKFLRGN